MTIPAILSVAIFIVSLFLIFWEGLNRTIAAMVGAVVMVVCGIIFSFYNEQQALASIDFNTLGLLLGMMILVTLLEPTGFFEYLAVWAARLSKGHPVRLLVLLGGITTVISMFLANVTTIVLIAPVTILICEILGISPQPFLLAEALLSDTGGVATLVGDPPNVLIASAGGLTFTDFLTRALPVVVFVWIAALLALRFLFRRELAEIPSDREAILSLNPKEVLKDRAGAFKVLGIILAAVVFLLFEDTLKIQPSLIAMSAAAFGLLILRPNIRETLKLIEWDVLVFFAALFVMVGGMEQAGVLHDLANLISTAKNLPPVLLGISLMWVVAILSAIIDNIPITIALIPVVLDLTTYGINPLPLWWAIAFGAGFGGNGTIIGSTANVVIASLSEKTRHPITAKVWNKRGLPVMLVTCVVASILYAIMYPILSR